MGLDDEFEADYETNATPKLSLSKLPNKNIRQPWMMPTPPCKLPASVPFQWEEAPGKPRTASSSSSSSAKNSNRNSSCTTARRLDLPPRLLLMNNYNCVDSSSSSSSSGSSKFSTANFYSPTTVLDGSDQCDCQSFSVQNEFPLRSLEEEISREPKYHCHHLGKRDGMINNEPEEGSLNSASWPASENLGFPSSASFYSGSQTRSSSSKLNRFKRRSSFASLSHASSNFLAGIYGGFKQVIQRRWRQDQKKI